MSAPQSPLTSSTGKDRHHEDTQESGLQQIDFEQLGQHVEAMAETVSRWPISGPSGLLSSSEYYHYYRSLLADAEVKLTDEIDEPMVCLQIVDGEQSITYGTLGNFSLLIGKAKSRKTYLLSALVASLITTDPVMQKLRGQLPNDQRTILYFDTEQHKGHVKRVLKRIAQLAGQQELPYIRVYQLKKHAPNHRLNAIRVAIEDTPGLGLIVIDGIRDTVFDINDAKEATDRATDLLQWTEEKDAHLITVIHENKGNSNARGHLGSELVNKAETVISINRDSEDKNVSIVTAEYCRNKEFEPFGFSIGEDGLPFLVGKIVTANPAARRSGKQHTINLKLHEVEALLRRAFTNDAQLRYSQLRTNIMEASGHAGCTLGKTKAEELIQRLQADQYLIKGRPEKEKYFLYQLNSEKLAVQSS